MERCFREDRAVKDQHLLERITLNPKVMTGKPVIRGTRLTVEYILNLLAHGAGETEILNIKISRPRPRDHTEGRLTHDG